MVLRNLEDHPYSYIFLNHPFCQVSIFLLIVNTYISSNHPKSELNLQCGLELNEFRPPNSSNDLCLNFWVLLLLYYDLDKVIQILEATFDG